ncbi:MAG: phosphatidylglycerophosphatase A [Planctomycetes bacterium]|nr:phosphatidylglycerophosphatase A [Planctomycetota bacterium]
MLPGAPSRVLATFFGSGLFPWMPGTCGTLAAAIPLLFVPAAAWPWVPAIGAVVTTLGCVAISRQLPAKDEGGDPGWFVLDEVAGMWLTACALAGPDQVGLLIAFVLFRVFDITKPPPVRSLERVGGGWGIVLDDLMAAVYALVFVLLWGLL